MPARQSTPCRRAGRSRARPLQSHREHDAEFGIKKAEKGVKIVDRVIFHCDLNSFYASVELLSHPELRHLPVAVCGDPASRHGIILAKNEPAKVFRVKTAETIWQAKRK